MTIPITDEMIERAAMAIFNRIGPYVGTPEQIARHGDGSTSAYDGQRGSTRLPPSKPR